MAGCTAGYDVSSCATAVWHIARLSPRILSRVKKVWWFGVYKWNHRSVCVSPDCSNCCRSAEAQRVLSKRKESCHLVTSCGNCTVCNTSNHKASQWYLGSLPYLVTQLFWNGMLVVVERWSTLTLATGPRQSNSRCIMAAATRCWMASPY